MRKHIVRSALYTIVAIALNILAITGYYHPLNHIFLSSVIILFCCFAIFMSGWDLRLDTYREVMERYLSYLLDKE
jgi:predicted Na+-dependent transporter